MLCAIHESLGGLSCFLGSLRALRVEKFTKRAVVERQRASSRVSQVEEFGLLKMERQGKV